MAKSSSLTRLRLAIASMIFLGGLATLGLDSRTWLLVTLTLYSLPLLCQLIPIRWVQLGGLWWGIFLVAQALISPWVPELHYVTLPPNFSRVINVHEGIPGIRGIQSISTDHEGFRTNGDVNYEDATPFRIFAIGGSTTEEILLDDAKTWTSKLEESLNAAADTKIEVINTGVSGLRSGNHLATLEKILHLNPDMAIFMLGANDWNHQIRRDNGPLLQRLVINRTEPFWLSNTMLGRVLRRYAMRGRSSSTKESEQQEIIDEHGDYYTLQRGSLQKSDQRSYRAVEISANYTRNLAAIDALCKRNSLECLFVTQPNGYSRQASEEYLASFWMTPPDENYTLDLVSLESIASLYNSYLLSFGKKHGHEVCDVAAELKPSFDNFYDDFHFNEKGSDRVAGKIAKCVAPLVKGLDNLPVQAEKTG